VIELQVGAFPFIRVHTGTIPGSAFTNMNTNPFTLKAADPTGFVIPIAFVFQCPGAFASAPTSTLYVRTPTQAVGFSAFMFGIAFPGNQNALYCWRNQLSPEQPNYPQYNANEAIILQSDFDELPSMSDCNYSLYYIKVSTIAIQPI